MPGTDLMDEKVMGSQGAARANPNHAGPDRCPNPLLQSCPQAVWCEQENECERKRTAQPDVHFQGHLQLFAVVETENEDEEPHHKGEDGEQPSKKTAKVSDDGAYQGKSPWRDVPKE